MPKLGELAHIIKADLTADPSAEITRARPFDVASEGDVTLALETTYTTRISESQATAIIVRVPIAGGIKNLLVARRPKLAFARAIEALHKTEYRSTCISNDLITGDGTVLGAELSIHPRVTI